MKRVVVDVEIIKTIEQCTKGWDSTDEMGVGVAVVYDYQDDRFRIYGPEEVEELRHHLLMSDRIEGYNIWSFDFPVIWGLSKADWMSPSLESVKALQDILGKRCDDLLRRIWIACGLDPNVFNYRTHGGYKLDDVARATLGRQANRGKIAHGAEAPKWYQKGLIQRVANYCVDDVALERDLGKFVDTHGYVIDPNSNSRLVLDEGDPLWQGGGPVG